MIECKKHLNDIKRNLIINDNRDRYLCLNMNENFGIISDEFLNNCISKITVKDINLYPQYYDFIQNLATYNNVDINNVLISNGSDSAIKYIFETYINENDNILTANPTFAMYEIYSNIFNANLVKLEYDENLNFPKEQFIQSIEKNKIKLAVIVNPNNPTGTILSQEELVQICNICRKNNTLLIIDEAYYYFYNETFIEKIKEFDNLIILRTFSKLCGLAGARVGYMIANKQIIDDVYKVRSTYDVSSISLIFANELIKNPNLIDRFIKEFRESKEILASKLKKNSINFISGHSNFILIECGDRVEEIVKKLQQQNILVYKNLDYVCTKNFIRVSIGSKKSIEKFCEKFLIIYKGEK